MLGPSTRPCLLVSQFLRSKISSTNSMSVMYCVQTPSSFGSILLVIAACRTCWSRASALRKGDNSFNCQGSVSLSATMDSITASKFDSIGYSSYLQVWNLVPVDLFSSSTGVLTTRQRSDDYFLLDVLFQ